MVYSRQNMLWDINLYHLRFSISQKPDPRTSGCPQRHRGSDLAQLHVQRNQPAVRAQHLGGGHTGIQAAGVRFLVGVHPIRRWRCSNTHRPFW